MLSLTVLGSGSSGNCAVVRTDRTRLLVDAGLSARRIVQRLEQVGLRIEDLDGILLTHEHQDHTYGLEMLCRKYEIPLLATPLTQEVLARSAFVKGRPKWKLMQTGTSFEFQDVRIECFPVPHDAVDPVGFVIQDEESRLGVLSDVGFITNLIRDRLRGAHSLFIEANYDTHLLDADTKRPWSIKQRISGRHGHLSNDQTADLVRELAHGDLHHIVLGHLSDDCNDPDMVRQRIHAVLHEAGVKEVRVHCAARHEPLPWLEVARRRSVPVTVAAPAVTSAPVPSPAPVAVSATTSIEEPATAYRPMKQAELWCDLEPA